MPLRGGRGQGKCLIFFLPRFLRAFVEVSSNELDAENLSAVLEEVRLQETLRTHYGRGTFLRVGGRFWKHLLEESSLMLKPQTHLAGSLATAVYPKPALDLLACLLTSKSGDNTVHTLDLDPLLVDKASPTTTG